MNAALLFLLTSVAWANSPRADVRSIIGANDLEAVAAIKNPAWKQWARSVGRVDSAGAGYCTFFRVGPDLFMTNQHCSEFKPCGQVVFRMGYEPGIESAQQAFFQCTALIHSSLRYDYAIFRGRLAAGVDSYPTATLFDSRVENGTPSLMVSYAGTFSKQVDQSAECRLVNATPILLNDRMSITHACDSLSGSSGAPILDRMGNVLAIHWGGKGDGKGEDKDDGEFNVGILMQDVLADLRSAAPTVYDELKIVH